MAEQQGEPQPRKRGRRKKIGTRVLNFRITDEDYDAYCVLALRAGIYVRSIIRDVVHMHAPREQVTAEELAALRERAE